MAPVTPHLKAPVREYRIGFLMTMAGALLVTPDALIVRLISLYPWTLVFWRGLLVSTTLLGFFVLRDGPRYILAILREGGETLLVSLSAMRLPQLAS